METLKLIIIRGASGSGKSTLAKKLMWENSNAQIFEADQWFYCNENHEYRFDPTQLGQAHKNCQERLEEEMLKGESPLIMSNTSMRLKELEPYLNMAQKYGYEVTIYKTKGPWDPKILATRNVHGVPLDTIKKQIARYEPHEDEKEYLSQYEEESRYPPQRD